MGFFFGTFYTTGLAVTGYRYCASLVNILSKAGVGFFFYFSLLLEDEEDEVEEDDDELDYFDFPIV